MAVRGVDHLVLAARDLDALADAYRRMGFFVGGRNRHPWGTENHIVQIDGAFLELISMGEDGEPPDHEPRRFSFGAYVRDALEAGSGFPMLALDSGDAVQDAAKFARVGAGDFEPFRFEREGRKPDGSVAKLAFTLAFATDSRAPGAGFFVCQQHYPQNFWNVAFQAHANTAKAVSGVVMVSPEPEAHRDFLLAFTGATEARSSSLGVAIETKRGRFEVLKPAAAKARLGLDVDPSRGPHLAAYRVAVSDPIRARRALEHGRVPFREAQGALLVPSEAALGASILFERA